MASKKISQSDARRYRMDRDKANERVCNLLRRGSSTWGGTHIGAEVNITATSMIRLRTAKQLGYALFVVVSDTEDCVDFRAMKPGEG